MEETDAQTECGGLISGEIMQDESHTCYLALPYLRTPVAGQLFFSNYKLMFFPTKDDSSFEQFQVRTITFLFPRALPLFNTILSFLLAASKRRLTHLNFTSRRAWMNYCNW